MANKSNPNTEHTHFLVWCYSFQFYRFLVLNFKIFRVLAKGHKGTRLKIQVDPTE